MRHESRNVEETFQIAFDFAQSLNGSECIALEGDLGAGKTHFVKGLAQAFSIPAEEVSSPTFTLVQEYKGSKNLVHLDLYRLETLSELKELALEDYLEKDSLVLVEWADKFKGHFKADYRVRFLKTGTHSREIEIIHER